MRAIHTVNFIASDSALRVMAEELGIKGRSNLIRQILGAAAFSRTLLKILSPRCKLRRRESKSKSNRTLTSERTWRAALTPQTA